MVKNLQKKQQKKEKRKKKRTDLFLSFFRPHKKHTKRERESTSAREREKMSENIINNKQMTTRERQHIEVAKLEAELNALKVDAFAKVRRCCFFFFLRWSCVLNHHDDEISSRSIRALSSRFSAATTDRQKPKRVYFCTRC